MELKSGVTFIEAEDIDRLASEATAAGAAIYRFSTKGATEGASLFDAIRHTLPLDPPLVGSQSLDALSDSLWSGLHDLDAESVVIFWSDSADYKKVAEYGYPAVLEVFKDITDGLANQKLTAGKTKQVTIYIS